MHPQYHNTGRKLSTCVIDTRGKFVAGFKDTSGHIFPRNFLLIDRGNTSGKFATGVNDDSNR
jgi:hypothetical protein